jgi:hypothetical protein
VLPGFIWNLISWSVFAGHQQEAEVLTGTRRVQKTETAAQKAGCNAKGLVFFNIQEVQTFLGPVKPSELSVFLYSTKEI